MQGHHTTLVAELMWEKEYSTNVRKGSVPQKLNETNLGPTDVKKKLNKHKFYAK